MTLVNSKGNHKKSDDKWQSRWKKNQRRFLLLRLKLAKITANRDQTISMVLCDARCIEYFCGDLLFDTRAGLVSLVVDKFALLCRPCSSSVLLSRTNFAHSLAVRFFFYYILKSPQSQATQRLLSFRLDRDVVNVAVSAVVPHVE